MSVTMICPNLKCGSTVVAAETTRGRLVRCAQCQTLFLVPRSAHVVPAAPVPPAAEAEAKAPVPPAAAPAKKRAQP